MSRTMIRSRVENNSSLGSRFDWFVVEVGYSTDDSADKFMPNQVRLNPSVKARVHDPIAAAALCKHYQHDAMNKKLPLDYKFLSYNETQELFESNGWRIRSFDDTFANDRSSYVVRFKGLGDVTVTACNERQAIARAQERVGDRGIVNADTLDSAWIVMETSLEE